MHLSDLNFFITVQNTHSSKAALLHSVELDCFFNQVCVCVSICGFFFLRRVLYIPSWFQAFCIAEIFNFWASLFHLLSDTSGSFCVPMAHNQGFVNGRQALSSIPNLSLNLKNIFSALLGFQMMQHHTQQTVTKGVCQITHTKLFSCSSQ